MPSFKWEAVPQNTQTEAASITLNLDDATGLVTLEQFSSSIPSPAQPYAIMLQSLAFANMQIEGSVQESITCINLVPQPCPTIWGTLWGLSGDMLTVDAPATGWGDFPRQNTASVQLKVSLWTVVDCHSHSGRSTDQPLWRHRVLVLDGLLMALLDPAGHWLLNPIRTPV